MKKVEKVSIADISFTLDYDAYIALKQYLDSINTHYADDPDGREITRDIEARIAELILDEQVYTKVVSKPLIDSIISQLGNPEEFDDEIAGEGVATHSSSEPSIPRRLHRSREGRVFGGMCRGIAQFWDIDVTWVRLGALLPLIMTIITAPWDHWWAEDFFEGWAWAFFVTYIVLWIALPVAKTPRQKLEARGERITSSSIRQSMQDGVSTPAGRKAASVTAELVTVVGRVLLFFVKFVVAIVGFSLLLGAIGVFTGMVALPFEAKNAFVFDGVDILSLFDDMRILSPVLFAELIQLCVVLPLFIIGMTLLSFTFGWRLGRVFYGVTLGVWAAAIIFFGVVASANARLFRDRIPERIERLEEWADDWDDDRWDRDERRDRWSREADWTERDVTRDVDGVNVDLSSDSLVIVVKKDGSANDTIKITDGRLSISASASDSLPADQTAPETDGGRKRVEIRRVE